jgi:GDP-D-mannose 3',5'-epimerase
MTKILIAGGGGFIGGWLTRKLVADGHEVKSVDIKPINRWYQVDSNATNLTLDLSDLQSCLVATKEVDVVYNLAADMGGMGFIENNKALCMLSVLINTHLLMASKKNGVSKFFFASSACVYNQSKQLETNNPGLRESDAYPAMPEDGYGWEKLFSERMTRHFQEDFGINVRIGRFHNVYGPFGTYDGGREKVPAALCRKIANAKIHSAKSIEIWGDGLQTRSFTYIEDTIKGIELLMNSSYSDPINLGSSELISIADLAKIVMQISGYDCKLTFNLNAPKGVRGRNSDNSLIMEKLGWQPSISLLEGLTQTYSWIESELKDGKDHKQFA